MHGLPCDLRQPQTNYGMHHLLPVLQRAFAALGTEGISDLVMEIASGLHNLRVSYRHPFPTFDVLSLVSSG